MAPEVSQEKPRKSYQQHPIGRDRFPFPPVFSGKLAVKNGVFFFEKFSIRSQASPEGDLKLQEILNHNVGKLNAALTAWLGRQQKLHPESGESEVLGGVEKCLPKCLLSRYFRYIFWGPNLHQVFGRLSRVCKKKKNLFSINTSSQTCNTREV